MNWWESDPIVKQPNQQANWWESDPVVSEEAGGLITRFGKQIYNAFAKIPSGIAYEAAGGGIKTGIASVKAAYQLTKERLEKGDFSPLLTTEEKEKYKTIVGKPKEEFPKILPQWGVSPATTVPEKGIDIAANIAAVAAQIITLRKVLPVGTSEPVIWEIQNQVTGGQKGMGVLYGSMIGGIGKLSASELAKATAETAGFYTTARLSGAEPEEALTQAAIPAVLRGVGAIKKGLTRKPEVTSDIIFAKPKPLTESQKVQVKKYNNELSKWIEKGKPSGEKPVEPEFLTKINQEYEFESARQEVLKGVRAAKRLNRAEVLPAYSKARAERAAAFEAEKARLIAEGVPVNEALKMAQTKLKGSYLPDEPEYAAPDLTPNQLEIISKKIDTSLRTFEKVRATTGLQKFQNKVHLQDNEIEVLSKVLGSEFGEAMQKLQPMSVRVWRGFENAMNFPKIAAAFDIQMRRQARWLRARHPVLYAKAVGKNIKGYFSEKAADRIKADYESNPWYESARKDGSVFLERGQLTPGKRTEQFRTRIAAKIPILGKGYQAAERGFIEGFNWMQTQLYALKREQWLREGREVTKGMRKDLTEVNNTLLGMHKPTTAFGKQLTRVASVGMWSPTLTWSRIRTPSLILTNPTMRKEVAATLSSYLASGFLMLLAAQKIGKSAGVTVNWSPLSSDFGKIKMGNTRIDIFGDGGPYIRALSQLIARRKQSATGRYYDQRPVETILNFIRNKRNPMIDLCMTIYTKTNFAGQPAFKVPDFAKDWTTAQKIAFMGGKELFNRFAPFFVQGTIEAIYNDNIITGLLVGGEEFFSGSTVSYKPSTSVQIMDLKNLAADFAYDKNWDELNSIEQEQLKIQFKSEFDELERKLKSERVTTREATQTEISLSREPVKAAKNIRNMLDKNNRKKTEGISLETSRTIDDWYLNDARYKKYQKYIADNLNQMLYNVNIENMPEEFRERIIKKIIQVAKRQAQMQIKYEITL